MKKTILATIIALFTIVGVSNAQLFVGGSVNYNSTGSNTKSTPKGGSTTTVDNPKTTSFSLTPKVGFSLSEKLSVGAGVVLNKNTSKTFAPETVTASSTIGIAPFARYYVMTNNKFKMFVETELTLCSESNKNTAAGVTTEGPTRGIRILGVTPVISYELSEKFELEANLNFLNFNFNSTTSTIKDVPGDGDKIKSTNNTFNFGVDSDNVLTTGFLRIGFVYKL